MQDVTKINVDNQRIKSLIEEILSGQLKKDTLKNSSYAFTDEVQAAYFSNMRNNMNSDMAYAVMNGNQEIGDLKVLEVIKP